jgi:pyridoxamine 5'-phosphate oxidase family protein
MSFSDAELAYLAGQRLGRLATMQPDGTLQASPVGFRYNPATGTVDIGGFNMTASRKFRNVADNGRAAFVVDDIASVDPWRALRGDPRARRGDRRTGRLGRPGAGSHHPDPSRPGHQFRAERSGRCR